ncbi:MAG TPA: acyl carrier protein [Planctomycetota bacterium]|nr:acyl carrier protein [Planctomycetota bacterium]
MTLDDIRSDIDGLILEVFELGAAPADLGSGVDLRHMADSLKFLELMAAVGNRYRIEIDDHEESRVRTRDDLVQLVARHVER